MKNLLAILLALMLSTSIFAESIKEDINKSETEQQVQKNKKAINNEEKPVDKPKQ